MEVRKRDAALAERLNNPKNTSDQIVEMLDPKADEFEKAAAGFLQKFSEFKSVYVKTQNARNITHYFDNLLVALQLTRARNEEDLRKASNASRLVISTDSGRPLPDDQRSSIENAIYELNAMNDGVIGGLVYKLTLWPTDMLVLTLVMVMGLLGSSLQLIYIYITQFEQRALVFYILRPFFGVITSFVIYVVAKAGIPLIADPTRLGGTAPVNPYFISFLAIISGLLSEKAIVTLSAVGSNYFRESDPSAASRWARKDIHPLFKTAGRDPASLRHMLHAKALEWEAWLGGREPMPPQVQTMIAAVLSMPPRVLFTDIAPELFYPSNEPGASDSPDTPKSRENQSRSGKGTASEDDTAARRIRAFYRSSADAKNAVDNWLTQNNLSPPVTLFIADPTKGGERDKMIEALSIPELISTETENAGPRTERSDR